MNTTSAKELPTVSIRGYVGTGKTVIAHIIQDALEQYGIKSIIQDQYGLDKFEPYNLDKEFVKKNLQTIIDKNFKSETLEINTVQLSRSYSSKV